MNNRGKNGPTGEGITKLDEIHDLVNGASGVHYKLCAELARWKSDHEPSPENLAAAEKANAIQALYGSTSAGRDVLNFEQQRRERDRTAGAGIGKSIYDIFYPANGQGGLAGMLGDIFKGGSKGSGSTSQRFSF